MGYLLALGGPGLPSYVNPPFAVYAQNSSNVTRTYNTNLPTSAAKDAPQFAIVRDLTNDKADLATHQATANPTPYATIYMDSAIASSSADQGISFALAQANNWLMLTATDGFITEPASANSYVLDPAASGLADPGNPDSWPSQVLAKIAARNAVSPSPGFNAIWLDQVQPDYRTLVSPQTAFPTSTTFYGYQNNGGVHGTQYADVESYAIACRNFMRTSIAALQQAGIYVIANAGVVLRSSMGSAGGWNTVNDNDASAVAKWWTYLYYDAAGPWRPGLPIFDALAIENWMIIPTAGLVTPGEFPCRRLGNAHYWDYWAEKASLQTTCQNMGIAFHGESFSRSAETANDIRNQMYSYVSFLLNWNGAAGSSVHEFYTPINAYRSDYGTTVFLGEPQGDKTQPSTGVYKRVFKNGTVYLNASYTDTTIDGHAVATGTALIV